MSNRKHLPAAIRKIVYEKYNGHCAYCGKAIKYKDMQVDHINSVYMKGEDNDISNLTPACRSCNFYKGTMTVEGFRRQLGLIVGRLEKVFIYRLARDYGLISEDKKDIRFYFEEKQKCQIQNTDI